MYRILVCDDEKDIVSALKIYLMADGYQVFEAYNGREALEILKNEDIHLVLMDIMMPVMNGYEAAKMIRSLEREDAKKVPIIAMTANAFTEDRIRAKEAGMDEHVAKPVDVKLLVKVISRLVGNNLGGIRNEKEKME